MSILSDRQLLTEIAHLYYEEGLNQEQISRRMNMSRSLISKMLTKARSVGIECIAPEPVHGLCRKRDQTASADHRPGTL